MSRQITKRLTTVAIVMAVLGAAACGTQAADQPGAKRSTADGSTASTLPQGWTTCQNRVFGYEIGYPGSWHTTDILNGQQDPEYACLWFGPRPFDQVDEQGRPLGNVVLEGFGYPMEILSVGSPLEGAVRPWSDPDRVHVLSREDMQIDGHPAVRLEVETLVDVVAEPGPHYLYVIELDGERSIHLHTTPVRGIPGDYEENKRILDQAVQTLRFIGSG